MNQNTIGAHAGIVWNLLNNNKRWEYCDLKQLTKECRDAAVTNIVDVREVLLRDVDDDDE